MTQLTIRDVPEEIAIELKGEAEEEGRSVNAVARAALMEHVERRRRARRFEESLAIMDAHRNAIRERLGHNLDDSTPLIREDRDSR